MAILAVGEWPHVRVSSLRQSATHLCRLGDASCDTRRRLVATFIAQGSGGPWAFLGFPGASWGLPGVSLGFGVPWGFLGAPGASNAAPGAFDEQCGIRANARSASRQIAALRGCADNKRKHPVVVRRDHLWIGWQCTMTCVSLCFKAFSRDFQEISGFQGILTVISEFLRFHAFSRHFHRNF